MDKKLERCPVELRPFFEECSNLVSIESTNKIRAIKYGRRPNINMPRHLDFLQWIHISTLEAFWAPARTLSHRFFLKLSSESGHPIARFHTWPPLLAGYTVPTQRILLRESTRHQSAS